MLTCIFVAVAITTPDELEYENFIVKCFSVICYKFWKGIFLHSAGGFGESNEIENVMKRILQKFKMILEFNHSMQFKMHKTLRVS